MIISASYRTDLPAFYGPWFANRFRAGFVRVVNPYGGPPSLVPLRQGVDGFVFWTRNALPFRPMLREVKAAGLPFILHYTLTAYPRPLEAAVPAAQPTLGLIRELAAEYGRRAVVWRYDPILLSDLTPLAWHLDNFAGLAAALDGAVDEVVVSFAQIYRKTARALATAAREAGFAWFDPDQDDKRHLVARLAGLAATHGMRLTLCTQPGLVQPGLAEPARCIDAGRLSELAGRPIPARRKGNRPGCCCAESRDIGDYDSCPQGCVYCYAVGSRQRAKDRLAGHDARSEFLFPPPA